jgi:hypothetical protein
LGEDYILFLKIPCSNFGTLQFAELSFLCRPILVLPSADMQVVECELTEAEQDFYQALYKKSKVTADPSIETSSDAASSETSSIYLCCNVNKCLN